MKKSKKSDNSCKVLFIYNCNQGFKCYYLQSAYVISNREKNDETRAVLIDADR